MRAAPRCICPSGHARPARSFSDPRCVGCTMAGCRVTRAADGCPGLKARRRQGERPVAVHEKSPRIAPTGTLRREVYELHGSRCLCCNATEQIELDHVVPLSLGGSNDVDNMQPLCHRCNCRKADRYIDFRGPQSGGVAVLTPARERRREPVRRIRG